MFVQDLVRVPVESKDDVLALMARAKGNRATFSTNMNEHSSRSHSILTVYIEAKDQSTGEQTRSKLHLVDLAGSERLSKTGATGDRLLEAQAINKSLSALGNVIERLQQKQQHIPYRDSRLTFLLQDSLGGNSKTLMIMAVVSARFAPPCRCARGMSLWGAGGCATRAGSSGAARLRTDLFRRSPRRRSMPRRPCARSSSGSGR